MLQPDIPRQRIVPLLVEKQLPVTPQTWINLAVFIEIRSVNPRTVSSVHIKNSAFANVDEEADVVATSARVPISILKTDSIIVGKVAYFCKC